MPSDPVYLTLDGKTVQCGPYLATGIAATAGAIREKKCIEDYQSQGYVRQ